MSKFLDNRKLLNRTLFILIVISLYVSGGFCNRIVNGTNSNIIKYPFVVSLRTIDGFHVCGGSIIAPRYILTAAHCVNLQFAINLHINYATTKIQSGSSVNVVNVKRIIVHENYDPLDYHANDIALLELYSSLLYNYKTIAPISLPTSLYEIDQVAAGAAGVLVGWGKNGIDDNVQEHLQEVDLKIYSDDECAQRHNHVVTPHQICGGVDEGWKGQCSGDSGGPLIFQNNVQLGIVSWSIKPCTKPPFPGVYTKVSHYIDWIHKHIE